MLAPKTDKDHAQLLLNSLPPSNDPAWEYIEAWAIQILRREGHIITTTASNFTRPSGYCPEFGDVIAQEKKDA